MGKRDPKKKLVGAWFDEKMVARMDLARKSLGEDRSEFLLRCLVARLRELGFQISDEMLVSSSAKRAKDLSYLLDEIEKPLSPPAPKPKKAAKKSATPEK